MNTEIPGCQKFNEPLQKKFLKNPQFTHATQVKKDNKKQRKTTVKHIKWRLGLDML